MNKIQRTSFFLRIFFVLTFISLPLFFIYNNLIQQASYITLQTINGPALIELSSTQHVLVTVLNLLPLSAQLFMIYCFIKVFRLYEKGHVFSSESINYIKRIGYALLVAVVFHPITEIILSYQITQQHALMKHQILVSITVSQVAQFIIGVMVIVVSWIMREASEVKAENDDFL